MKVVPGRKKNRKLDPIGPKLPVEPPLRVHCRCPHCKRDFGPLDMKGDYLKRACPLCNNAITAKDYDAIAANLDTRIKMLKRELDNLAAANAKNEKLIKLAKLPLLNLFRPHLLERANALRIEEQQMRKELNEVSHALKYAAYDRYYTGEYFQSTHTALKHVKANPYELKPFYNKDGIWRLSAQTKSSRGLAAEIEVFNALLEEVQRPSSTLYRARLVPNIYLPKETNNRGLDRLWDQIDLILLTTRAAFVIEIKNRVSHVVSCAPFAVIYSSKASDCPPLNENLCPLKIQDWSKNESRALAQNSQHALAFDTACSLYLFEQIYEELVFVGTKSFSTNSQQFIENINVSILEPKNKQDSLQKSDAEPPFIAAIKSVYKNLDELVTTNQVDAEAERLINTYGDLNQRRGIMHTARIKSLQKNYSRGR